MRLVLEWMGGGEVFSVWLGAMRRKERKRKYPPSSKLADQYVTIKGFFPPSEG